MSGAQALEAFACDYPVELVHGCAHAFLASFPFLGPELVYSDPPYLHATRRSARRYRFDYEEVDHGKVRHLRRLRAEKQTLGTAMAAYRR